MDLPRSAAAVPKLVILDEAGSTNAELVKAAGGPAAADWPDLSVIVTDNQTAGRGRLDRSWTAPAGTSLAISVLLRPMLSAETNPDTLGWIPLLAGLAMVRAVRSVGPRAVIKWPNDVLIGGKKVSGILAELIPASQGSTGEPRTAIVVGAGLNLAMTAEQLPVETATSLAIEGAESTNADRVLGAYLSELTEVYQGFLAAGADPSLSGLRDAVLAVNDTVGRRVSVQLPSGDVLQGEAQAIDAAGRLVVGFNGGTTAVAAGDVTHLRY
jgi:BirA family biotin operon repressor/biotin-[acetyl-CoA-carboxylase] ligase